MARRRRGPGLNHPGSARSPWQDRPLGRERSPAKERSPGRATDPRRARSLAEAELEKRRLADNLLEGEEFVGGDGYRYVVLSKYSDGSVTVQRADGALRTLKNGDRVAALTSGSPLRGFLP